MTGKTIVILGGGLGGLTAAGRIRMMLPAEHRVVVVERRSSFYLWPFNMRLMAGEAGEVSGGERPLSKLAQRGIEWLHGDVLELDPQARLVRTSAGTLQADFLIIALGAEKDGSVIPGFAAGACNLYDPAQALQVHKAVQEFQGGKAAVLVCRTPFSCPSAPYEAALLMDTAFRHRGIRDRVEMALYTPEGKPMAAAGPGVGDAVIDMLKQRDIQFCPQRKVQQIVPGHPGSIVFEAERASFDLLVGIPPHVAPAAVRQAGLTDETGWIPVDLRTLETRFPNVFAIGDVNSIRQPNPTGLFVPKAGVFADEEARVVAQIVAARAGNQDGAGSYDGKGFCYIEIGDGLAAYGHGNFYAYPAARVFLEPPSQTHHEERRRIELDQLSSLV